MVLSEVEKAFLLTATISLEVETEMTNESEDENAKKEIDEDGIDTTKFS